MSEEPMTPQEVYEAWMALIESGKEGGQFRKMLDQFRSGLLILKDREEGGFTIAAAKSETDEPDWCQVHQHFKWCEHNGGTETAIGWQSPTDSEPSRPDPCPDEWSLGDQSLDRTNRGIGIAPDPTSSVSRSPVRLPSLHKLFAEMRNEDIRHTTGDPESDNQSDS